MQIFQFKMLLLCEKRTPNKHFKYLSNSPIETRFYFQRERGQFKM